MVASSRHFCGIFVGSCSILWQTGDEKKEDGKEVKKEVKEELEEEKLDAKDEKVEAKEEEAAKTHKDLKDLAPQLTGSRICRTVGKATIKNTINLHCSN